MTTMELLQTCVASQKTIADLIYTLNPQLRSVYNVKLKDDKSEVRNYIEYNPEKEKQKSFALEWLHSCAQIPQDTITTAPRGAHCDTAGYIHLILCLDFKHRIWLPECT